MSDQAGRMMTFEEFAPRCCEAANRWIDNNPQQNREEPNGTFALVATLRNCISRGIDQLQHNNYRNSTQVTGYCPICAERAKQEQQERMTPKPCRKAIATEPTKSVNGSIHGKGTALWFCPECGTFSTPAHKFCWTCGQALSFDVAATEPKGEPHA